MKGAKSFSLLSHVKYSGIDSIVTTDSLFMFLIVKNMKKRKSMAKRKKLLILCASQNY